MRHTLQMSLSVGAHTGLGRRAPGGRGYVATVDGSSRSYSLFTTA